MSNASSTPRLALAPRPSAAPVPVRLAAPPAAPPVAGGPSAPVAAVAHSAPGAAPSSRMVPAPSTRPEGQTALGLSSWRARAASPPAAVKLPEAPERRPDAPVRQTASLAAAAPQPAPGGRWGRRSFAAVVAAAAPAAPSAGQIDASAVSVGLALADGLPEADRDAADSALVRGELGSTDGKADGQTMEALADAWASAGVGAETARQAAAPAGSAAGPPQTDAQTEVARQTRADPSGRAPAAAAWAPEMDRQTVADVPMAAEGVRLQSDRCDGTQVVRADVGACARGWVVCLHAVVGKARVQVLAAQGAETGLGE
jgi:hypothetical protein